MTQEQILTVAKTLPRYDSIMNGTSELLSIADEIAGECLEFDDESDMNKFITNLAIALS
jgi:hypothetical protein